MTIRPVLQPFPLAGAARALVFAAAIAAALSGTVADGFEAGMPNPPASPTRVRCGVVVLDIIDIDDVNESFEAELFVMASWHDPRLAFDAATEGTDRKIYQGSYQFAELFRGWWPQLLIVNQQGRGETSAIKVTVFSDGRVRYAEQLNARLETPMQLHDFPFDAQRLHAQIVPFGNPTDEVVLEVESDLAETTDDHVRHDQEVNVAGWSLESLTMAVDEAGFLEGGREKRFSRLVTTIHLQRRSWQLVWQMLFPMLVIVSMIWSIFWIDSDSLADRLNVSFIGVLTIVAYQFVVIDHMPRMSYLTFTDSLLLVSFLAMAATIPQSLFIHRLIRRGERGRAEGIDRICRWAFPLAYLVLVGSTAVWYWLT